MKNNKKCIVSIVLGSYNRRRFLKQTIKSVRNELSNADFDHEIIVVDGGSSDGSICWLSKQKDIITIIQHNRGTWKGKKIERKSWGYFMNLGFKAAQGIYICMISDDCLIVPGAIINGVKQFDQYIENGKKIGALAFFWRNWPNEKQYHVNVTLSRKLMVNHGLFLRDAVKEIDWINETDYMFYCADGDLSLRLWENQYTIEKAEDSYVEHYAHAKTIVRRTNGKYSNNDFKIYHRIWKKYYDPDDNLEPIYSEKAENRNITRMYKLFYYTDIANRVKKAVRKLKPHELN